MDDRSGEIYDLIKDEKRIKLDAELLKHLKEMQIPPTARQLAEGKVRFRDPCPCGSGKKFKNCCLWRPRPVIEEAPNV